ncbi:MAG: GSU2403 family nucleotidyltransferase fold protein [Candidatus Omnitrophica bacterium]|nr:GSU2403 family nucleotidyltransferase fold protein [Candidatus Omnitrophota bacterium]
MIDSIRKILKVFADNNLFEDGVELIGSWCFKLYQNHLGVEKFPLTSLDVDFLIPIPFHGKEHSGFIKQLEDLGFEADFKRDGSLFLWNADLKIEFITVEKSGGTDKAVKIKKLGIDAIPLRHVGFLLDKPITITDAGVKIRVPSLVRFCLHKLIIAPRRKEAGKSLKDLQQAIYTAMIVDKQEMRQVFSSLPKRWQQTVLKSLEKAERELLLLREDINKLRFTLQNAR